jgi:alpha-L-arabinofuranosidase
MRNANPDIKLVASGGDAFMFSNWNEEIIKGIGGAMDFLSIHIYMPGWSPLRSHVGNSPGDYYAIAATRLTLEEQIQQIEEMADRLLGTVLPISVDEWNTLGSLCRFTDPYRTQREAIGMAGIIHAFHRQAKYAKIAAMFAMLNSAAPSLLTTLDTIVHTPIFHVLRLYRQLFRKARILSETECPTVEVPNLLTLPQRSSVPLLDVSANLDEHRLTVFVINRDHHEKLGAEIEITDFKFSKLVRIHTVAANGYQAANSASQPEMVIERIKELEWKGHHVFLPCSVTAIVMDESF